MPFCTSSEAPHKDPPLLPRNPIQAQFQSNCPPPFPRHIMVPAYTQNATAWLSGHLTMDVHSHRTRYWRVMVAKNLLSSLPTENTPPQKKTRVKKKNDKLRQSGGGLEPCSRRLLLTSRTDGVSLNIWLPAFRTYVATSTWRVKSSLSDL